MLLVYRNNLIAGGAFYLAGGATANSIAKWNGSSWAPLGSGMVGVVYALDSYPFIDTTGTHWELYAGGNFNMAGGVSANNIAKWIEFDTTFRYRSYHELRLQKNIPSHGTVYDSISASPHDKNI